MSLELKFNPQYQTLDLFGQVPAAAMGKVKRIMTYNPILRCYQSEIKEEVLDLAESLKANISFEVFDAVRTSIESDQKTAETKKSLATCLKTQSQERIEIINYIVKHSNFGLGRLLSVEDRVVTVGFFFPPSQLRMTRESIVRTLIPIGTPCKSTDNVCTIP